MLGGLIIWPGKPFPGQMISQISERSPVEHPMEGDELPKALQAPDLVAVREGPISPSGLEDDADFKASDFLIDAARASSAGRLQELALRASANGDETLARQLELMEEAACGPLVRGDVGSHIVEDAEGYRRWEAFCADALIDVSADPELLRRELLEQLDAEVERQSQDFLTLLEQMGPEEAYVQLLADSTSPLEIDAIALLEANGYVDLDLSSLIPGHEPFDENAIRRIYSVAPELYGCARFGHCGPQSMKSIEACLFSQECQPGADYLDLLRWVMSPRELELAWRLVDLIRQRETRDGP